MFSSSSWNSGGSSMVAEVQILVFFHLCLGRKFCDYIFSWVWNSIDCFLDTWTFLFVRKLCYASSTISWHHLFPVHREPLLIFHSYHFQFWQHLKPHTVGMHMHSLSTEYPYLLSRLWCYMVSNIWLVVVLVLSAISLTFQTCIWIVIWYGHVLIPVLWLRLLTESICLLHPYSQDLLFMPDAVFTSKPCCWMSILPALISTCSRMGLDMETLHILPQIVIIIR